jgi:NAD dependent epimerase/dehydratase family enzyme
MLLPFKLCLGARLGDGNQYMSWVHIDDVIGAINFLITNKNSAGAYNVTSPNPVSNSKFTKMLAQALGRYSFLYLPKFLLILLFGEIAKELLSKVRKLCLKN